MVISGAVVRGEISNVMFCCSASVEDHQLRFTNSSLGLNRLHQMGFELQLFTVVQITNLNVFLVAINLLSKPFLQRKEWRD